jgi:hypothetical protein
VIAVEGNGRGNAHRTRSLGTIGRRAAQLGEMSGLHRRYLSNARGPDRTALENRRFRNRVIDASTGLGRAALQG